MARILLLSVVYEPDTVSTATIVTNLAKALSGMGHEVSVLTSFPHYNVLPGTWHDSSSIDGLRRPIRHTVEDNVDVTRCYVPSKGKSVSMRLVGYGILHVLMLGTVLRRYRDRDFVIVVSPPFTLALIGLLAARVSGGRVAYNVQELWPDVLRDLGLVRNRIVLSLLTATERFIYRKSDYVLPIGESFRGRVVERGARPEKVIVVPNFVDTDSIRPVAKRNALSERWDLSDRPVVLYAGNIGLTQDFDLLLSVAARDDMADTMFLIVGDGAGREELEKRLKVERRRNVRIEDFLPKSEVPNLYGLADVIVVPLKRGHDRTTTPSKVLSAMAAARPIVACSGKATDLERSVVEASAGLVVEPGDAGAMAGAITALLDGSKPGSWRPQRAAEVARAHSPSAIARRYDALIRCSCVQID